MVSVTDVNWFATFFFLFLQVIYTHNQYVASVSCVISIFFYFQTKFNISSIAKLQLKYPVNLVMLPREPSYFCAEKLFRILSLLKLHGKRFASQSFANLFPATTYRSLFSLKLSISSEVRKSLRMYILLLYNNSRRFPDILKHLNYLLFSKPKLWPWR